MDTLCGVGLPELIIMALLAFVLIGPERSQELAVRAGRFLRTMMTSRWWKDVNEVTRSLRDMPTTLIRMAELEDAQKELERTVQDIDQTARAGFRGGAQGMRSSEQPSGNPWGIPTSGEGATVSAGSEPASETQDGNADD